ncbi:cysteine-rich venom protein pseudecin-like [Asterias rubens]|uniref:cysteine-rich venom protein pseudecin-like n=1 Tax=Asterias rubens TaxID=7604 RepID=UPI0014559E01|nr:cysteine-rich venom protein pseudecin-like [Asterias rubens]
MMEMKQVLCLRWVLAVCLLSLCWALQGNEKTSFALYNDQVRGSLHRETREVHGEKVRVVRQASGVKTYTDDEQKSLLDAHLEYRRSVSPGAADMNKIGWNLELANLAKGWAERCQFEHGHPSTPQSFNGAIAQNIWQGSNSYSLTRAVEAWYEETEDYDYGSASCASGKECGHYRVMVFGNLQEIGCGTAVCGENTLTVCNYGPSVSPNGVPYKAGPPCARCSSGQGWCDDKLCNQDCSSGGEGCECKLKCRNCGVLDSSSCQCDCKASWGGTDCFEKCADGKSYCSYYTKESCMGDVAAMMDCPAKCELCATLEGNTPAADKCCDGKQCGENEVLDEQACTCVKYLEQGGNAASPVVTANLISLMVLVSSLVITFYSR